MARTKRNKKRAHKNLNGCILYEGRSMIDYRNGIRKGDLIVVILTGLKQKSENRKTGAMLQTWILLQNMKPTKGRKTGADKTICGDCPHAKNDTCYVNLGQGPRSVWVCWKRGNYEWYNSAIHNPMIIDRSLRFGTYGDPSAAPVSVWQNLLRLTGQHTGYTHQWRRLDSRHWGFLMASVDTRAEADLALGKNWRCFATCFIPGFVSCPASAESIQRAYDRVNFAQTIKIVTCLDCLICSGDTKPWARSAYILPHGSKINPFNRLKGDDIPQFLVRETVSEYIQIGV